ncbi:MAG: tRNA (guanosine(37)-N1)-methyltransferase TrmD [Planctomycetes bacterium]|nr:tRNA (guanosine(37)-N1)-methyltransferase TrmD [Planctomycetota bacterium]
MRIDIVTIFPELFEPFLRTSMVGIAAEKGAAEFHVLNLRDFTEDRHRKVDDRPFGGGPGMVFRAEPVFNAVEHASAQPPVPARVILLTPAGRTFDQARARDLAKAAHLVLVCGHYEGFDERIRTGLAPEELSIGDFVLTGGEVAAMAVVDAVVRLLPGVLGDEESNRRESFEGGLLDHPHYTRPEVFRGMAVPDVLRSGNHAEIEKWRREQALKRTRERRADLLEKGSSDDQNR